jgi:hypothetical protein
MYKVHQLVLSVIVLAISSVSSPTWACDAMGPNRHVGVVTQIDSKAGTFTIIDAQRRTPMTFIAGKKLLDGLPLNRNMIVTFRMAGERMMADAVVPAS